MRIQTRLTPMTWFVILSVIAIGLALGLSPDPHTLQHLHTTATAYRVAIAALLIPYVLIWFVGFYAFAKLLEYSRLIKGTKDGAAFSKITVGMGIIAFSLVVPTIISLILNGITAHHPSFKAADTIINNYLGLYPGMIGFLVLYNGARLLLRTTREGLQHFDLRWHAPWFFLLCIVFSHLVIENHFRGNPYHLSLWLLVITFIVPYLYGWMVGLLSAYEFHWYAKTVKGVLYRKAVQQFSHGIVIVMLASIAVQFLNVTIGQRIGKSLGSVLLVDYILLAVIAAGLILMALGTKKLKRMEEL